MMGVRLLPQAEEELDVAAEYYERLQNGLGQALLREVRRSRQRIANQPLASRAVRADIHVCSVSRFPYRI